MISVSCLSPAAWRSADLMALLERIHPCRKRWAVVLDYALCRDGSGTYTSIPMLIAEESRWICHRCVWSMLSRRKTLRQSPAWRLQATGNSNAVAHRGNRCASRRGRRNNADPRRRNDGMSIQHPVAPEG